MRSCNLNGGSAKAWFWVIIWVFLGDLESDWMLDMANFRNWRVMLGRPVREAG